MKPEEKKYILENIGKESPQEIARKLGIKEKKIRNFIEKRKEGPPAPAKDKLRILAILLIITVGLAVYANTFGNKFVWDDDILIIRNEYIRDWNHLKEIFTTDIHRFGNRSNFYRPIQNITYAIDYTFWQLNPTGYHISNAAFHITAGILIYLFLFSLLGHIKVQRPVYPSRIALAASLLWIVHPLHTQCTSYISGRGDILAAAFILLTCYTYISIKNVIPSAVFFMFALISKETAVITPLLLILCSAAVRDGEKEKKGTPHSIYRILPHVMIAAVYIWSRFTILHFPEAPFIDIRAPFYSRILTSAHAIMILLRLLVMPFGLNMTRNIAWDKTILDPAVAASVVCLVSLFLCALRAKRRSGVIFFGLFWFFIAYLPYANIFPINANVSEHWMYIPSIGIFLAVSFFLMERSPPASLTGKAAIIISLLAFYGTLTVQRNFDWKDEITFYQKTLQGSVESARVHANLGNAYGHQGIYDKAIEHYKTAIRLDPNYAEPHANMGLVCFRLGKIDEAIALYEKANILRDDLIENHANLGIAYYQKGVFDKAGREFEKTLALNPNHIGAMNGLGLILTQAGKPQTAQRYFEEVIKRDPNNFDAYYNLGLVYSTIGRHKEAIAPYRKALEINPNHAGAHNNLAVMYYHTGQYRMSVKHCDRAVELGYQDSAELLRLLEPYR